MFFLPKVETAVGSCQQPLAGIGLTSAIEMLDDSTIYWVTVRQGETSHFIRTALFCITTTDLLLFVTYVNHIATGHLLSNLHGSWLQRKQRISHNFFMNVANIGRKPNNYFIICLIMFIVWYWLVIDYYEYISILSL